MDVVSALLHGINVLLALVLMYLYVQNYRKMKTKFTIGLTLFAFLFLLHSAMGLYFDASMVMYSDKIAENAALVLEIVKAVSLGVLLRISMD